MQGSRSTPRPIRLSFGLPVRNGEETLDRAIESVLSQTFEPIELIISDNASFDATGEICRRWERADPRVRYCPLPENRGVIANFNRTFRLSQGQYFRFIGADDWLERRYAERCVEVLDETPDVIGVTTYQAHWEPDGTRGYAEYIGPRVTSKRASARFAACLALLRQSLLYFDPCYTMYRRTAMAKTQLLRDVQANDALLAAELSLLGPYAHVPECLANRARPPVSYQSIVAMIQIPGQPPMKDSPEERMSQLLGLLDEAAVPMSDRVECYAAALRYYAFLNNRFRVGPARYEASRFFRERVGMDKLRGAFIRE